MLRNTVHIYSLSNVLYDHHQFKDLRATQEIFFLTICIVSKIAKYFTAFRVNILYE